MHAARGQAADGARVAVRHPDVAVVDDDAARQIDGRCAAEVVVHIEQVARRVHLAHVVVVIGRGGPDVARVGVYGHAIVANVRNTGKRRRREGYVIAHETRAVARVPVRGPDHVAAVHEPAVTAAHAVEDGTRHGDARAAVDPLEQAVRRAARPHVANGVDGHEADVDARNAHVRRDALVFRGGHAAVAVRAARVRP